MNISEKAKGIIDSCRFCWMCRHVCPVGNATGLERNTARARALAASVAVRGAENPKEIIDNVYECTLCGACTNNCVTGWDPKVFIQEIKTDCAMNGLMPDYIAKLFDNYRNSGNIYGLKAEEGLIKLFNGEKSDILLILGQDALYKSAKSAENVAKLLKTAGVKFTFDEKANDTGAALWFLLGKTEETREAAIACAEIMNGYKTVVVYDPVDLKLIRHEYNDWGIDVKAEVVSFNEFLLKLADGGALKVKKSNREYTLQDNYAYARELDDVITGRKLIEKAGVNKEMLLIGKEANLAGNLIMNEYMPAVMRKIAELRWADAANMGCKTLVTENPAEYELLKATCPDGFEVLSIEEMLSENL